MSIESNPALLNSIGLQVNIHPVCLICKKECKRPYAFWSFQMPPQEFCDEFEEGGTVAESLRIYPPRNQGRP